MMVTLFPDLILLVVTLVVVGILTVDISDNSLLDSRVWDVCVIKRLLPGFLGKVGVVRARSSFGCS